MSSTSAPLWVITTFYNPAGYRRRFDNFKAFRKHLNAPLLVVELAQAGQHQLNPDDADIVLSLTGESRIWQKERLLNIALAHLPPHVEFVAWVDCDVLFERAEWPQLAAQHLERQGGMLQLIDYSVHLPEHLDARTVSLQACRSATPILTGISIAKALRTGVFDDNEIKLIRAREAAKLNNFYPSIDMHNCYGMAWSARRAVLDKCGFYDTNIIGGGDAIQVFSAIGKLEDYWNTRVHAPKMQHYAGLWAAKAKAAGLFDHVGSIDQSLYHLWHGSFSNRNYRGRHAILVKHDFDPLTDIRMAENGTWEWTNPQGELALEVDRYFFSRKEDGTA